MRIKNFKQKGYSKNPRMLSINPIITERFLTTLLKSVSNQRGFKRVTLQNFLKFLNKVPFENYESEAIIYVLLIVCKIIIRSRLEGISDKEELIEIVNLEVLDNYENIKNDIIFPTIISGEDTTDKEKQLIKKTIDIYLRYDAIISHKEDLSDIITDIGSGNVNNLENTLQKLRLIIDELNEEFKRTDANQEKYIVTHTHEVEEVNEKIKSTFDHETSVKLVLKTGLQMFNEMLSIPGGFLGGKAYIFYSDTNSFKSALMKHISVWIQKYNANLFMEEFLKTGKRPTILYISLEDGENEDINRLFSVYTKQDMAMVHDAETASKMLRSELDRSIIDITQINSKENSINLKTINGFIKQLEESNYKVIALIIDSFDLMAPEEEDVLMGITDETTIFSHRAKAMQKFIGDQPFPLITSHQLNRAGNQTLTELKMKGATDLAKSLGRSFISGAYDIERRMHWSAFIYTEISKYDNEMYLEIKREKCKYKRSPRDYMVHLLENRFYMTDDIYEKKPLSRSSIIPQNIIDSIPVNQQQVGSRGVQSLENIVEEVQPMFQSQTIPLLQPLFPMTPLIDRCMYMVMPPFDGFSPYDITEKTGEFLQTEEEMSPFGPITPTKEAVS